MWSNRARFGVSSGVIFTLSVTMVANTVTPADLLARLENAIRYQSAREPVDRDDSLSVLPQLRSALDQGDFDRALSHLQKLAIANVSAAVQEQCCELQSEIFAKKHSLAQALVGEIPKVLLEAGAACLAARDAKELDPVVIQLADKRDALIKIGGAATRQAIGRSEKALAFVQSWQKYLNLRASDPVEAKARLIYLANIDISHLMIERSRLVGEIEKIADPTKLPPPPGAPTDLVDWKNDDGSSELSWTNTDESTDCVVIEKQTLEGTWKKLAELPPNVTTFHIPNPDQRLAQ